MPEFAKIEYFDKIRYDSFSAGVGYIDLKTIEIKTQDPNAIKRYGLYVPLYDDKTIGTYQGENSHGQIPTGTYIVLNGDNYDSEYVSGIIFTTAKKDGRGASAIYYNEGRSFFDDSEIADALLYKDYILAAYHPPVLPIFVKEKRIGGLWVKQGEQLVKPSGVYVKQGGEIKKI